MGPAIVASIFISASPDEVSASSGLSAPGS
ncbi:MAG: hypothetical protein JWN54_2959 [Mycobacterium sp.]|jgi:hypothetical protein|nr:hypothetical protein [Mycobacterium sp.]